MSTFDIYNPPPAPVAYVPPGPEPLRWTRADLVGLVVVCGLLALMSALAWWAEPSVGLLTALGGTLVALESWFTALGFLHRHPEIHQAQRARIFLAALVPWMIGLGLAAALMAGLFAASDLVFGL